MRNVVLLVLVGCGNSSHGPDAPPLSDAPPLTVPRVIAGGGIADGPVVNGMNLYVIDNLTRLPIANAMVAVGDKPGMTDATGLFVAPSVSGPQLVTVKASGYNSAAWYGVNGSNVTIDVEQVSPYAYAPISGSVLGLDALTLPAGHTLYVQVLESGSDRLSDLQYSIPQFNPITECFLSAPTDPCTFSFNSRVGSVALFAIVHDVDNVNHTLTTIGWADRTHVTVVDNVAQSGLDLAFFAASATVTVDLGQPPAGYSAHANVALELGADGFVVIPAPDALSFPMPVVAGSTYRLMAYASSSPSSGESHLTTTTRRGLANGNLVVDGWLASPTLSVAPAADRVSWDAEPAARIAGCDIASSSGRLVVRVFDGSTTATIPVALRLSGFAMGVVDAIGGEFDPQSFSFDDPAVAMHAETDVDVGTMTMTPDAGV